MALENVITSLVLDVIDHDQTQGVVKAIALDSKTRYVKATIVQHGSDYPVDENATITLTILRPDNVGVQITGSVVDVDNADRTGTIKGVYAELTQAALAKSGTLRAQFKMNVGEQILRTEIFSIKNGIALDGETSEWAEQYEGYNLDELVQSVNTAVATVDGMEQDVTELKSGFDYLFEDEQLINAQYVAANNNTALVNNNDGTYTIGTTDFGSTTFGGLTTLTPGDYYLFGVPNGIAYLSTVGTSQSYANRVFENTSNVPKKIHIDTEQQLWVCFRSLSKPTSSYTISPSLYFHKPKVYDALRFMGVLESGTDLNNLLDSGIYFLSSDRSYINAPLTSGYLFVLATVNAIQQICIQYGSSLISVGAIYKRDGLKSGVTADWHRLGRLFNHNIAFFGDSIMWGRDGSASASTRTNWQIPVIVRNSLQVSTINYGVRGQGYLPTDESPACAYDNISAKNFDNFDTMVLCYGAYDGYHPLGSWNSDDETTIMGQFNKIINYIFAQKPTMRVIVFAPFNGANVGSYSDYWYGARNHQDGYVSRKVLSDTLKQACDYYWIPYIEQYDSPINAKNITTYLPDGVHPNENAYKQIGEWFAAKIGGLLS